MFSNFKVTPSNCYTSVRKRVACERLRWTTNSIPNTSEQLEPQQQSPLTSSRVKLVFAAGGVCRVSRRVMWMNGMRRILIGFVLLTSVQSNSNWFCAADLI